MGPRLFAAFAVLHRRNPRSASRCAETTTPESPIWVNRGKTRAMLHCDRGLASPSACPTSCVALPPRPPLAPRPVRQKSTRTPCVSSPPTRTHRPGRGHTGHRENTGKQRASYPRPTTRDEHSKPRATGPRGTKAGQLARYLRYLTNDPRRGCTRIGEQEAPDPAPVHPRLGS